MKKKLTFLVLLLLVFATFSLSRNEIHVEHPVVIDTTKIESEWEKKARLAKELLSTQSSVYAHWQAFNTLIYANKKLHKTHLNLEILQRAQEKFKSQKQQEFIYKELVHTHQLFAQHEEAIKNAEILISMFYLPKHEKNEISITISENAIAIGEYEKAEKFIKSTLPSNFNTRSVLTNEECENVLALINLYYFSDESKQASQYVDILLSQKNSSDEQRAHALLIKGGIYEQDRYYEEARECFIQALDIHPNRAAVEARIEGIAEKSNSSM